MPMFISAPTYPIKGSIYHLRLSEQMILEA